MTGQVHIKIRDVDGLVKHDFVVDNNIQDGVMNALALKMRHDTDYPDALVPNFMFLVNNLGQTKRVRIQGRANTASGGLYFNVSNVQFDDGSDNMEILFVGLTGEIAYGEGQFSLIAYASTWEEGVEFSGPQFNPSDTIEVAYLINVNAAEINTNLANNYFKEVASIMLGGPDSGGVYVAINEKYVVPNRAVLQAVSADLVSKDFTPKGTGTFIGTSEGDLEWNGVSGSATPYYVKWVSHHYSRPDLVIGTTDLDQPLREAYPAGTNIETRFSMELRN